MKHILLSLTLALAASSVTAADLTSGSRPASASAVLNLSAQASVKAAADEMVVVLSVTRDGQGLGVLNQSVLAELQAARAQAATAGVNARLGNVSSTQTYSPQGKPWGWQVRGEVVLESRKLKELGDLAGQLSQRLALSGVSFRLSREKRLELEQALMEDAAKAFRQKAQAASLALGYAGFDLKEMSISEAGSAVPRERLEVATFAKAAAVALPSEGGEFDVSVSVSGSVALR